LQIALIFDVGPDCWRRYETRLRKYAENIERKSGIFNGLFADENLYIN